MLSLNFSMRGGVFMGYSSPRVGLWLVGGRGLLLEDIW